MNKELHREIADNIKKYRKIHEYTQAEVSEKLELDVQYYAKLEQGRRSFNIDKIVDFCEALHIRIENIIPVDIGPDTEEEMREKDYQLKRLNDLLANATSSQISAVIKFVEDFIPYM